MCHCVLYLSEEYLPELDETNSGLAREHLGNGET